MNNLCRVVTVRQNTCQRTQTVAVDQVCWESGVEHFSSPKGRLLESSFTFMWTTTLVIPIWPTASHFRRTVFIFNSCSLDVSRHVTCQHTAVCCLSTVAWCFKTSLLFTSATQTFCQTTASTLPRGGSSSRSSTTCGASRSGASHVRVMSHVSVMSDVSVISHISVMSDISVMSNVSVMQCLYALYNHC